MINVSNYYCLVILLIVKITTCQINGSNANDIESEDSSDDFSGSADDVSGSGLKIVLNVCELPINQGHCNTERLGTDEDRESDNNDLNALIDLNESNTLYFGYNNSTKKCEEFNYDGCGGNSNRFETINDCRKTCYTPLKNFLAKVTDLLVLKITNGQ